MAEEADAQGDKWPAHSGRVRKGSTGITWKHGQFQSPVNFATPSTLVEAVTLQILPEVYSIANDFHMEDIFPWGS